MSKRKTNKDISSPPAIAEEQPEAYKKVKKEKQESYSRLRDTTDVIRFFSPKP